MIPLISKTVHSFSDAFLIFLLHTNLLNQNVIFILTLWFPGAVNVAFLATKLHVSINAAKKATKTVLPVDFTSNLFLRKTYNKIANLANYVKYEKNITKTSYINHNL